MTIMHQHMKISRLLSYGAKRKILLAAPSYLHRARWEQTPDGLHQAAMDALWPYFPSLSAQEMNILAFYLISQVAMSLDKFTQQPDSGDLKVLKAVEDDLKASIDSMNEMGEMTSLRLQMMMDRRSKFMTTLSNILKKISTTNETLVSNLK